MITVAMTKKALIYTTIIQTAMINHLVAAIFN